MEAQEIKPLDVTITSKHLKDNSWSHGHADGSRACPLQEALVENEEDKIRYNVGTRTVRDHKTEIEYAIPINDWHQSKVEGYITRANEGEELAIHLTLRPINS